MAKDTKFVDDLSFKTEEDYKNDVKSVHKELETERVDLYLKYIKLIESQEDGFFKKNLKFSPK